jgi:hypothetical protein
MKIGSNGNLSKDTVPENNKEEDNQPSSAFETIKSNGNIVSVKSSSLSRVSSCLSITSAVVDKNENASSKENPDINIESNMLNEDKKSMNFGKLNFFCLFYSSEFEFM